VDLVQLALGRLHERHRVLCVPIGLREAGDLSTQLLADGESGRVVSCSVDAVARGQALHRLLQLEVRALQLPVSIEGLDVRVDSE
jgi:hypothetical protein